jgi:hypothetical protein
MGFVAQFRQQVQRQEVGQGETTPDLPPYATGTVHHDAVLDDGTVVHHHQVFEAGRLVAWEQDDAPGPWALVRPGDPLLACPRDVAPPDRVAATAVRVGGQRFDLPPLDDARSDAWSALPHVPDATAVLHFTLTGSPVGVVRVDVRYVDGARPVCEVVEEFPQLSGPEAAEAGEPAAGAPEMAVTMTWRNYLRMRSGEATALEAIEEGGTVDGRWTLLLLLHGLLQEPEYAAAYRSLPVVPDELRWWGEVAPWVGNAGPD